MISKKDSVELVTPKEALKIVQDFFQSPEPIYSLGTIYNKVSLGQLTRYGARHKLMLDKNEVINKLCRHFKK